MAESLPRLLRFAGKTFLSIRWWVRFLPLAIGVIPKPIGPTQHGAFDYILGTVQVLAPSALGLTGVARWLCYGFAANTLITNALTKHPLGIKKVIPLRLHGRLEIPIVPALLLLPWATGAFRQRNARNFFFCFFAAAFANFLLTDYDDESAQ